jgi:transcriptional regulator with XRE-family HTH domain
MASRRQELSQRRKAVGFTQESLAEYLGVERSTVIRWEAGDSEPLPSIRPNLARALQVSIDQLAELLTTSEIAATTQTLSTDLEVAIPAPLLEIQPPGRLDEAEFENSMHPQVAETVEALRRALRSAGVSAEDLAAMLLVGGSSQVPLVAPGPDVSEPPHTGSLNGPSIPGVRSKKTKRLLTAGAFALALPVFWWSAPFVISHSSAVPRVVAETPEHADPVGAIRAPNHGAGRDNNAGSADSAGARFTPSPAIVDTSAERAAQPPADTVAASHTTRNPGHIRTTSRSIPSTGTTHSFPRTPAEMIATAGGGHRWDRFEQVEGVDHLW